MYDAAACREVLEACRGLLPDGCTVITTATVGPGEAAGLADLVADLGAQHVHAPVVGSVPAALAGGLTILTGGRPVAPAAEVLATLGRCVALADAAEAAEAKLLANGVLGDALVTLRRSLLCAELLTLPRGTALDVLESTVLAPVVRAKRADLESGPAAAPVRFAAGALAKDLARSAARPGGRRRRPTSSTPSWRPVSSEAMPTSPPWRPPTRAPRPASSPT